MPDIDSRHKAAMKFLCASLLRQHDGRAAKDDGLGTTRLGALPITIY